MSKSKTASTHAGREPKRIILTRDFSEAEQGLAEYRRAVRHAHPDVSNLSAEAVKRLAQLRRIIDRVVALQAAEARLEKQPLLTSHDLRAIRRAHARRARRLHNVGTDVEILTEAFYFFAWRFCEVIKSLPGSGFKRFAAIGVRTVRHDLIQHPEKQSRALNPNFMWGHDVAVGPVVKPYGSREIEAFDRGLYVNAKELLSKLIALLDGERTKRSSS